MGVFMDVEIMLFVVVGVLFLGGIMVLMMVGVFMMCVNKVLFGEGV